MENRKPAPETDESTTLPGTTGANTTAKDEKVIEAHEQAEQDIEMDPDFSPGGEKDDLDEAEAVQSNEDKNDLV